MMLICVRAAPGCRKYCPVEWIEGWWMEVKDDLEEIRIPTSVDLPDMVGLPNGEIDRRGDLMSAPVWEVRFE